MTDIATIDQLVVAFTCGGIFFAGLLITLALLIGPGVAQERAKAKGPK